MNINTNKHIKHPPILLASSSKYRAQLLAKLQIAFTQTSPNVDETPRKGETSFDLVKRLSEQKAIALTNNFPSHIIIGSDQVLLSPTGEILGKPLHRENAIAQLTQLSGYKVRFLTGLSLLVPLSSIQHLSHCTNIAEPISFASDPTQKWIKQTIIEPFDVYFKKLNYSQITNYLDKDQPFDCAGSFKSEGLGISLFEKLEGNDPNSLVGLPLIQLCKLLNNVGIDILN